MRGISSSRRILFGLLIGLAYLASTRLCHYFGELYAGYAPFWPAAGVASGALVVFGSRYAPAITLGSIVAAMLEGFPIGLSLWFAVIDTTEALIVTALVRRVRINPAFTRLRDVAHFIAIAFAGGAVNATLNAPVYVPFMPPAGLTIDEIWLGWVLGNAIGHLTVGGLLMLWTAPAPGRGRVPLAERITIGAAAVVVSAAIFLRPLPLAMPWTYLVLALVSWTAVRLGQRIVSVMLLGLCGLAAWAAWQGTGPFTPQDGPSLQVFFGICSFAGFGLAAVAAEREEAASLRDREARYRVLADASPNLMWTGRSDGSIEFFNRKALDYTGVAPGQPAGLSWSAIVHPEDVQRAQTALRAAVAARRTLAVEQRIRRADGEYRWHWCVAVPVDDPAATDGLRWIGTATDVHDRKLAELEVASWRAHYERAQAVGQLGSWESDPDSGSERLVWSSQLFGIFGIAPETFDGRISSFYERVHPGDRDRVRAAAAQAVANGTRYTIDHRIVRPDGEVRWVHEEADLSTGPDGSRRLVGICRDITERVRAEEERRMLETSLLQAQKLESLGILTGGIAHDFNNLLVGILGNASLALLDLPHDSPARPAIERIETSSMRAADLVKQMLAYSGKAAMQFEPVDVSAVVREMGDLLATAISKRAVLHYQLSDALPPVEADPTQLRQIVMNLITNASDAIGDRNGTITVTTDSVELDAAAVSTMFAGSSLAPGPHVRIEVADTGAGMDHATQARIFDPFFSTKFTGRGLGLAAVQGIVRSHGGAIRVESEPGQGTTFTVLLPQSRRTVEPTRDAHASRPPLTNMFTGTVLVIDDEDGVREATGKMLERLGFAVLSAAGGEEGLAIFAEHHDEITLVVLDLTMPGLNGAEVYFRLRQLDTEVRVLLASGYGRAEATVGFADGVDCPFLQKPFRPRALADAIAALLGMEMTDGGRQAAQTIVRS